MLMPKFTADELYSKLMEKAAPLPCQENYARQLCNLVAYHCRKNTLIDLGIPVDDLPYQGALVIAPTGQGKTYLLRTIAKLIDINVIILDASGLAHEGWKGNTLSQLLSGNEQELDDYDKWKRSILFIDEIDKMHLWGNHYDQSNPMENLLQLYNNGSISVEIDSRTSRTLDVSRFTIILGGAFSGLEKIIAQRLKPKSKIGFDAAKPSNDLSENQYLQYITMEDVKNYGFMPELLGRIGSIITIEPMTIEDYRILMTAENGSIATKYKIFLSKAYGVDFEIDDLAVEYVANKCTESKLGARAINPIINDVMRDCFIALDREYSISKVYLSANENECFVYYERDNRRTQTLLDETSRPDIFFADEEPKSMIETMINIYERSTHERNVIVQLTAFLHLSIHYLYRCCPRPDRCFSSLLKLADTTHKRKVDDESTFECMMKEMLEKNSDSELYSDLRIKMILFKRNWNRNTCDNLLQSLNYIYSVMVEAQKQVEQSGSISH